jgi:hypothetical protein
LAQIHIGNTVGYLNTKLRRECYCHLCNTFMQAVKLFGEV